MRVRVRVPVRVRVRVPVRVRERACVRAHEGVHEGVCACMRACVRTGAHECMHACMHACTLVCTHECVRISACCMRCAAGRPTVPLTLLWMTAQGHCQQRAALSVHIESLHVERLYADPIFSCSACLGGLYSSNRNESHPPLDWTPLPQGDLRLLAESRMLGFS